MPDDGTAHLSHAAPRDATSHTRAANSRPVPPFDDADFERAARGLIAQHPTGVVASEFGAAWDVSRWDFLRGDAPGRAVEFAVAAGALAHTVPGDFPLFSLAEVEALVIEENVVNFVLSKAKVAEKSVSFDELMGN